jgi:hypothetical protein
MRMLAYRGVPTHLVFAALCVLALALPADVQAQAFGCTPDPDQTRLEIGTPNAEGVTISTTLSDPSATVGFHFTVPEPSAASLYIGDQWFDIDLYLYARGRCAAGSWEKLIRSWSARSDKRILQPMRPDEQIANLSAGDYLMLAVYKAPTVASAADSFDPTRAFTARVALNPPYCGLMPPDVMVPDPAIPAILVPKRSDDALYQLGMTISPDEQDRGPFSLMTLAAFMTPPYTDLFDFNWVLDGQPRPDMTTPIFQIPTSDLPKTAGGKHVIQLTALGARPYPDPLMPSMPPTLSLQCAFNVPT